jgi:hypothetical protein
MGAFPFYMDSWTLTKVACRLNLEGQYLVVLESQAMIWPALWLAGPRVTWADSTPHVRRLGHHLPAGFIGLDGWIYRKCTYRARRVFLMRDWRSLCGFRLGFEISNVTVPTRRTLHPFSVFAFFSSSIDSLPILSKIKLTIAANARHFLPDRPRQRNLATSRTVTDLPPLHITAIAPAPSGGKPIPPLE